MDFTYQTQYSETSRTRTYPLHPGWLAPLTMIAGLVVSGPIAGGILGRCGYKKTGLISGIISGVLGLGIILMIVSWNVEWYWASLTLSGIHLVMGIVLLFLVRTPYRTFRQSHPLPPTTRGTYREIITGTIGGAFLGGLLGMPGMIAYLLIIDRFFSTLIPVTFEDGFAMYRLSIGIFFFALSGAIAGGCMGRFKPRVTVNQMFSYGFGLMWVYFTWLFALEGSIAIPGFQAGAATNSGWEAIITAFSLSNALLGFWWVVFLLFFMISPSKKSEKLWRAVQVLGINAAAAVTISITFGYPADMFLALGRHFERQALTTRALWCYERGLLRKSDDRIASYLQYRAALLNHKLGQSEKAQQGFRRVVAKYTWNQDLVKKASQFLDNLERSAGKKRVVLPGVETQTEYKGGYCVPNSLALVMRYWGKDITARGIGERITGLGSGTFVVNQRWFAEQAGFRHDFLPLASLEDIKRSIDAGFPVLVYVPAHVFAIVGYDEALETFVTYDVATHDVWVEYIQKDFIKAWKKQSTTLVLAYPPEQEALLPEDIRQRLLRFSDDYLHFHLHYFDAPTGSVSVPHLRQAAGETGEFFFPVTILYADFPGLRDSIAQEYDAQTINDAITAYFWDDFDEGVHLWGQYHDENWAQADWALRYSIYYLIGQERFDLVEDLITRINEEGQISEDMVAETGMINLASGEFETGIDRLTFQGQTQNPLYAGLAKLRVENIQGAIRELVRTIKESRNYGYAGWPGQSQAWGFDPYYYTYGNSRGELVLDNYGFPDIAVANRILIGQHDYGESKEDLEQAWENWVYQFPFDAPVAEALVQLYERRLEKLDKEKDAAVYQRLERKRILAHKRAARYNLASFSREGNAN